LGDTGVGESGSRGATGATEGSVVEVVGVDLELIGAVMVEVGEVVEQEGRRVCGIALSEGSYQLVGALAAIWVVE